MTQRERFVPWGILLAASSCGPLVGIEQDAALADRPPIADPDGGGSADRPASGQADVDGSPDRPQLGETDDAAQPSPDTCLSDGSAPSGPRICDPEDKRVCVVSRREDGVSCPDTWTEARRLGCGQDPANAWQLGECATHQVAFWYRGGSSAWCSYHPVTRQLAGSYGHDICGVFCGGVNTVSWGVGQLTCGVNVIPGVCVAPLGVCCVPDGTETDVWCPPASRAAGRV